MTWEPWLIWHSTFCIGLPRYRGNDKWTAQSPAVSVGAEVLGSMRLKNVFSCHKHFIVQRKGRIWLARDVGSTSFASHILFWVTHFPATTTIYLAKRGWLSIVPHGGERVFPCSHLLRFNLRMSCFSSLVYLGQNPVGSHASQDQAGSLQYNLSHNVIINCSCQALGEAACLALPESCKRFLTLSAVTLGSSRTIIVRVPQAHTHLAFAANSDSCPKAWFQILHRLQWGCDVCRHCDWRRCVPWLHAVRPLPAVRQHPADQDDCRSGRAGRAR
jgi:hypothetical protein